MNIWIDLTNSPHVNFFAEMIRQLQKEHKVILTCRHLANTVEMLDMEGFEYTVVGGHAGASRIKKLLAFPHRVLALTKFLKGKNIDVAISHSGFNLPAAARLLGIPSIYVNDNEHAKANWQAFLFANIVMIPEPLQRLSKRKRWDMLADVIVYPGVKEAIYLHKKGYSLSKNGRLEKIYIRTEPWSAQYYSARKGFMDGLLNELADRYKVYVLPRDDLQKDYYLAKSITGLHVVERTLNLETIVSNCDLFIGAGGTMTRELAILGIPTISIYQGKLLEVDKYLIEHNCMIHNSMLTISEVEQFYKNHKVSDSQEIMQKGRDAFELIVDNLLDTGNGR